MSLLYLLDLENVSEYVEAVEYGQSSGATIDTTLHLSFGGITVLCHFCKNELLPVIKCKNDKHLVTLYNVIFSNMTCILNNRRYIFYWHTRGNNVSLKWYVLGNLPVWLNEYTNCYFFKNLETRRVFGQNGVDITWYNDKKVKLVKHLMTCDRSFFTKCVVSNWEPHQIQLCIYVWLEKGLWLCRSVST